jgi:hypothetical protein
MTFNSKLNQTKLTHPNFYIQIALDIALLLSSPQLYYKINIK